MSNEPTDKDIADLLTSIQDTEKIGFEVDWLVLELMVMAEKRGWGAGFSTDWEGNRIAHVSLPTGTCSWIVGLDYNGDGYLLPNKIIDEFVASVEE